MIEYTAVHEFPQATSIVTLDDARILIDPGCDALLRYEEASFSVKPDLILLSHSDVLHIGGFVYGYRHLGWKSVPVYATLPVVNMGRTTMYDALKSINPSDLAMSDIDDAFDAIVALRYSQAVQLSGKCQGITISAFNAGHTLGGSIWKIVRGSDHIVYAVDWNHARDEHLNGCSLFTGGQVPEALSRPSLLITDAFNARLGTVPRSRRNATLFESISSTIKGDGSILIPVDSSSRVLEICELLEVHWAANPDINQVPIYFLSHSNTKTIGYAKSMLEWMSEKMINSYGSSGGLFDFKYVRMLSKASHVSMLPPGPKIILATSPDLDNGYSQQVLRDGFAANPANLVILMQQSTYRQDSLAGVLMTQWSDTTGNAPLAEYISLDKNVEISVRKNVPLEGQDLKAHLQEEQAKREEDQARAAMEERNRNILDADDSESEDEDERAVLAAQGSLSDRPVGMSFTIGSSALLSSTFDIHLEDPQIAKLPARLKTFPFIEKRRRFDDYGEILRPDEFKRADQEESEVETAIALEKGKDVTGKKRKWAEDAEAAIAEGLEDIEDNRVVPSKLEVTTEKLHLKCRLRYIDMEGLHDGKSLKNIVESVNPRKLVLVHAYEEDKLDVRTACERMRSFTKAIEIPEVGVTLGVSLDTNAYDVCLSDAIASSLHWQSLYEQEVAHITGKLIPRSTTDSSEPPILDIISDRVHLDDPRSLSLFVGDVRLADLRRALTQLGHTAELRGGGVLVCDGCVSVTKASQGEVLLQGQATRHFHGVRDSIYKSLAIIESA